MEMTVFPVFCRLDSGTAHPANFMDEFFFMNEDIVGRRPVFDLGHPPEDVEQFQLNRTE